jgi:peptide/nickel transport system permease protein
MLQYILNRLAQAVLLLFLLSTVVFLMGRVVGDPVHLLVSDYATDKDMEILKKELGLDRPLYEQYVRFHIDMLKGDFGQSFRSGKPSLDVIAERLPATIRLCGTAFVIAVFFGILFGLVSAVARGKVIDWLVRVFALFGQSIPPFVLGLLMIFLFSLHLGWFPTGGYGGIRHLILPSVTLAVFFVAAIARLLRGSLIEALKKDFIKLARIKGLPERIVVLKHAFKNSLVPVITYLGPLSVTIVTAALAVEVVFGWPGIGHLAQQATVGRDLPVVQTVVLILGGALVLVNLIVDLLYVWIDPRVRLWK